MAPSGVTTRIEKAARDTGFMYLAGHGISTANINDMRAATVSFFQLPDAIKDAYRISRENYRGFIPLGFFNSNVEAGNGDYYEGYKLHLEVPEDHPIRHLCDLYAPNKWPTEVPDFRNVVLRYWQACDLLTNRLLTSFAKILGVNEDFFHGPFDTPLTNMTLLHYPPQNACDSQVGIHPHKDTDALTILVPDPVGGLQLRCRGESEWIEADAPEGALIVNIGDMMELWSGGYFVSTPHRVINRSGKVRHSFPYFAVPRFDTVVAPLVSPVSGFQRNNIVVGEASRAVWQSNWPDVRLTTRDRALVDLEN